MTQSSPHADLIGEPSVRERIDALLDQALVESFPASDSISIGSSIAAIKQEDRQRSDDDRSAP